MTNERVFSLELLKAANIQNVIFIPSDDPKRSQFFIKRSINKKPMGLDAQLGVHMLLTPRGRNFCPFRSTGHRFHVTANFSCGGSSGGGDKNGESNVLNGESGYVQWYVLLPRGPNFCPFRSTSHRFRVTANFKILIISQWKI